MGQADILRTSRLAAGLAIVAFVFAGLLAAWAGEAAPRRVQDRNVSSQNPCSASFEKFPTSRAQALLDCQNEAKSKTPPHLTGDEASKIYDAYMGRMSKEQDNVADRRD
jgi:hypothetical protein